MFRRNSILVKEVILKALREQGLETPLLQKRLIDSWPEVMGPAIASYTDQLYIRNQTLFVHLTSPALRFELSMQRQDIVNRLNAHAGLATVRRYMDLDEADELVSFADVYAAMTSNKGYISQFTDSETVDMIRDILDRGAILLIQADGLATSQDNYSGADAERVGQERNTALADNRANTVISWLTADPRMRDVRSQSFIYNNKGDIRTVDDPSTRGLNAKLNRCVKVRIRYMIK